jgi:hypothetical protein
VMLHPSLMARLGGINDVGRVRLHGSDRRPAGLRTVRRS